MVLRAGDSYRAFFVLFVTAALVLPSLSLTAFAGDGRDSSRALSVWIESSATKVKKDDPAQTETAVWSEASGKITLSAARNEREAFQAVVTVDATISGTVSISDLKGAGGTIPSSGFDVFEVRYPTIVDPDWPDPLFPLLSAPTFAAGRNNPYLIDVYVPETAVPGKYLGNVTVFAGAESVIVPVELTVWNITYPKQSTLKTWFDDASSEWATFYGYTAYSSEHVALMKNVWQQYAKYKIEPGNCNLGQLSRNNMTVNGAVVTVDFSGTDPYLQYCIETMGFRSFRFPLTGYSPRRVDRPYGSGHPDEKYWWGGPPYDMSANYTKDVGDYIKLVGDHYRTKGWLDESYVYVTDEPIAFNDDVTSYWQHPNFHVVQQYYNLTHQKIPEIQFVNTVQMVPDLWNYSEVWAVPASSYHELDNVGRHADNQTVWWYNTDAGIATPGYEGRALYWDTYARGVCGALYWGTNYWDYASPGGDPWAGSNANGDGYLFYPAKTLGILDDVVPSQRLILARDGIEDYELLHKYGAIYGNNAAKAVAESVAAGSYFAGERFSPIEDDMIYDVREWLAGQITRERDFNTWSDTFTTPGNITSAAGLAADRAWEGSYSLDYANPAVVVDSLDAIGGWHSNDQPTMNSSVAIDTNYRSQGTGSLRIEWWRNDDPAVLGGYDYMRNGRVVTSQISSRDWSQYQLLEMDIRSEEHVPASLTMYIGDTGGAVVIDNLHHYIRYEAGPTNSTTQGWRHVVIDISQAPRSDVQFIEPIQYNYAMEQPFHHYAYWMDNVTVRKDARVATGTLQSKTIDLGQSVAEWEGLEYISQWDLPAGTTLAFETRSSNDGMAWSQWQAATPSGPFVAAIASTPMRYIQFRATLTSTGAATPVLSDVRINFKGIVGVDVGIVNVTADPAVPGHNGTFNLTANVINRLPNIVPQPCVHFYNGDPDAAGVELGNRTLDIPAGATTAYTIQTALPNGTYNIFARIQLSPSLLDLTPLDNKANRTLFVNGPPTAAMTAPTWAYVNQSIHFDAGLSTDDQGIVDYSWDFIGYRTAGKNVTYAYNSSGTKVFNLSVKDQHGATANATGTIVIKVRNPIPDFEIVPGTGTVLTSFNLSSLTEDLDGLVMNYTWDLGDNTTAFGPKATHVYADDASYNITMKVIFNNGTVHEASVTKTLNVTNIGPVTKFTATALVANKTVLIGFDAAGTTDPDDPRSALFFEWQFGDGSFGYGETAGHAYTKSGFFNVSLKVTDDDGASSSAKLEVKITNKPPVADFVMPVSAIVGDEVILNASKSKDLDGYLVNYSWNFADGSFGHGKDVTHTWASAGNFTVMLTVTDDSGVNVSNVRTIWIKPKTVPPKPKPDGHGNGLGMLEIGIIIAVIVAVCAAIGVLLYMRGRKKQEAPPKQAKAAKGPEGEAGPPSEKGGPPPDEKEDAEEGDDEKGDDGPEKH